MFQKIKKGKSQPSLEEVMCLKDEPILNGNKQEMGMIDTLVTFPGIDLDSAYAILRRIKKVSDICFWNKQQMEEVMTPSNAALLYSFLHTPFHYMCFFKSTNHLLSCQLSYCLSGIRYVILKRYSNEQLFC